MAEIVVPETTPIPRLLLLFAARDGRRQALAESLPGLAEALRAACPHPLRVMGLVRQEPDPFAAGIGENRGSDAALDLRLESGGDLEALCDTARGLAERVAGDVHVDLSHALAGPLHEIIEDHEARVRYVYLMRRRADWTDAAYQKHYAENHAKFGLRTEGIAGYTQHRVDPQASRRAAAATGFGGWTASSVSELYIPDLAVFFEKAMGSQVGEEAIADEERFVDRPNSVTTCMDVVFDLGRG